MRILVPLVGGAVLGAVLPAAAAAQAPSAADGQAAAYAQFLLGRHLESADDVDGAVRAFREAARLDPDAGEPLAELAALHARAGRPDDAAAAAEEALAREPDNRSAHRVLGLAYASDGAAGDAARAIPHLEQARETVVPDLPVELTLARLYLRTTATDEAITLLEALSKDRLGYAPATALLAEAYEQAGRHDEALRTLEEAAVAGPPSYRVLARLGEMYERRRQWDDAAAAYERAVALNPRNANVRRRLAAALFEGGEAARARDVLRALVEMRPRDTASLDHLAEVELALNDFAAAETAARTLIELEPDGLRGPDLLAQVFSRRREHRQVIATVEPVLERARARGVRPEPLARLYARLGLAYEQLDDPDAAARVYDAATDLLPGSLFFQARLAQAHVEANRLAAAARVLARAKADHPGNLSLAVVEAQLHGLRGDVGRGEDLLRDLVGVNGSEPGTHLALASFYSTHDRYAEAAAVLETARARFPDETSVLFQLGAVFERSGRFTEAERAFRGVLTQDPDHAPTLNYLGYMLADRGERLDESVALIERAVERDPHNGSYLDSLGWAYFKLDRLDLAEPPLRAAGDQLQRNSVVQDHLGDLLHRLGRYAEAIAAWERALTGDGEEIDPEAIARKIGRARAQLDR